MASHDEKDFQEIFRNSNIKERKKVLAKVLQFPDFNEEDDLRTATIIDVYYEMLSHLVNHGFPWREVASFFEMFQCLLNETQGKSLVDAITLFKEKLDSCAQYSCDNNLKSVIDYIFLTYFQHYKLYQFVLTQERADDITRVHLVVEPPRAVPVMRHAIPKSVWDEEQRVKQIDQMEQERKQERAAQYEGEMQLAVQQLKEEFLELDLPPENLTTDQLVSIVANVTAKKVAVTGATINQKIDEMHDSLEFKYKRANVAHDSDKGSTKSASSRRSKGNSGKK